MANWTVLRTFFQACFFQLLPPLAVSSQHCQGLHAAGQGYSAFAGARRTSLPRPQFRSSHIKRVQAPFAGSALPFARTRAQWISTPEHFPGGAPNVDRTGEGNDKSDVGLSVMHLLGICALLIALAALLIIGFLDVARNLLSRDAFAAPSSSNEERSPARR